MIALLRAKKTALAVATLAGVSGGLWVARSITLGAGRAAEPDGTLAVTVHEGTSMAIALSPDQTRIVIDLQGGLWMLPVTGGEARRITDEYWRRAPAVMVARRPVDCVSELSRRYLAHLDREPGRLRSEGRDERAVRRSRAALVARRHADRLLLRPQRQLRRVGAGGRDGRGPPAHARPRQRLLSGVVVRWTRGCLRVDQSRGTGRVRHLACWR